MTIEPQIGEEIEVNCWRCGQELGPGAVGNFCSEACQLRRDDDGSSHPGACACFDCVRGDKLDRWLEGGGT